MRNTLAYLCSGKPPIRVESTGAITIMILSLIQTVIPPKCTEFTSDNINTIIFALDSTTDHNGIARQYLLPSAFCCLVWEGAVLLVLVE